MFTAIMVVLALISVGIFVLGVRSLAKYRKVQKEWVDADAFFMAGGAGGLSLIEVYLATENHEAALESLQHVASNVIPPDVSPMDWAGYFESFGQRGEASTNGLISLWKGSLAEDEAVEFLNGLPTVQQHGLVAHRWDDPTHPDTDIHFTGPDGQIVPAEELGKYGLAEYQVKTYDPDNINAFIRTATEHPEQQFIINQELYAKLSETGQLSHFGDRVKDGQWSDVVMEDNAREAMAEVTDGLDVADHIPFVSFALFGFKAGKNIKQIFKKQKTGWEGGVDTALDAGRIAAGGIAAIGGAKLGTMIGTAIMPGVGTFVGGVVGALATGLGIGIFFKWVKDRLKYGDIMDAAERIGSGYAAGLGRPSSAEIHAIEKNVIKVQEYERQLQTQIQLARRYDVPNDIRRARKPTPAQAILARVLSELETQLEIAKTSVYELKHKLRTLGSQIGIRGNSAKKIRQGHGFLGTLVASQSELLLEGCSDYQQDLQLLQLKTKKFPHHPYRLMRGDKSLVDEAVFFKTVVMEALDEAVLKVVPKKPFWQRLPKAGLVAIIIAIIGLICVAAFFIGRGSIFSEDRSLSDTHNQDLNINIINPPSDAVKAEEESEGAKTREHERIMDEVSILQSPDLWRPGNRWVYRSTREAEDEEVDEAAEYEFVITREVESSEGGDLITEAKLSRVGGIKKDSDFRYIFEDDCIYRKSRKKNVKVLCHEGLVETSVNLLGREIDVFKYTSGRLQTYLSAELGLVKWIKEIPGSRVVTNSLIGYRVGSKTGGNWQQTPSSCEWSHRTSFKKNGRDLIEEEDVDGPAHKLTRHGDLDISNTKYVSLRLRVGSRFRRVYLVTDGGSSVIGFVKKGGVVDLKEHIPGEAVHLKIKEDEDADVEFVVALTESGSRIRALLLQLSEKSVWQIKVATERELEHRFDLQNFAAPGRCFPRFWTGKEKNTRVAELKLNWAEGTAHKTRGSLEVRSW